MLINKPDKNQKIPWKLEDTSIVIDFISIKYTQKKRAENNFSPFFPTILTILYYNILSPL